jgi:hypothetical protein
MRKLLLLLFSLALAVPALALPPQCSCPFCYTNPGTTNCTLPGTHTVVTCGYYIPHFCEGPA